MSINRAQQVADDGVWTFAAVRDALVETVVLWRRSPGDGVWPFASDGPWHLMVREIAKGDYDARGGDGTSSDVTLRPLPLTREEVAVRDRRSAWLLHIPAADDRRLVIAVCGALASGYTRPPWAKLKRRFGIRLGQGGLERRYSKAITAICECLNGAEIRR